MSPRVEAAYMALRAAAADLKESRFWEAATVSLRRPGLQGTADVLQTIAQLLRCVDGVIEALRQVEDAERVEKLIRRTP